VAASGCLSTIAVLGIVYSIRDAIGAGFLTVWLTSFHFGLSTRWLVNALVPKRLSG